MLAEGSLPAVPLFYQGDRGTFLLDFKFLYYKLNILYIFATWV